MVAVHGENVLAALVALSVAKKVTVYGVARIYGFPRIYRRMIKMQRSVGASPAAQKKFRSALQVSVARLHAPNLFGKHTLRRQCS